jgi:hypothetical protein
VLPPEISRHLTPELRLRLELAAESAGLKADLEQLAERARTAGASPDEVALAAGIALALASTREPGISQDEAAPGVFTFGS